MEIRLLCLADEAAIYEFLQAIPTNENGLKNEGFGLSFEDFHNYLLRRIEISQGINLPDWMVPESYYFVYDNGKAIALGKLRHYVTEALIDGGGHIGYSVHPDYRHQGVGTYLLTELLKIAKTMNINEVYISAMITNIPSNRLIQHVGGVLRATKEDHNYYIIKNT